MTSGERTDKGAVPRDFTGVRLATRLTLREFAEADIDAITEACQDEEIPRYTMTHQNNPIDGRVITIDVTTFVQNTIAAGQSTILLAVCNAGANNHELRFVSSEGATAPAGLTNANPDMMPALTFTP
ncbi:MAG TPA: hypothetical protein VFN97_23485 [Actinospica sp.]|nr:hypothetical protein [Actinospica sp.]